RLDEHVAELGERQPGFEADLDRVLGQHVRDREVLADIAQEVEQVEWFEPVRVVGHDRAARPREVEEPLELWPDRGDVGLDLLARLQVALRRAPGWVADHARPATDKGDRPAAVALEPDQAEDRDEVTDVEPRPGWIEADVGGDLAIRREPRLEAVRRGMELPPPAHLGDEPGRSLFE